MRTAAGFQSHGCWLVLGQKMLQPVSPEGISTLYIATLSQLDNRKRVLCQIQSDDGILFHGLLLNSSDSVFVTSILAHRDADLEWGGDHPISEEHGKERLTIATDDTEFHGQRQDKELIMGSSFVP